MSSTSTPAPNGSTSPTASLAVPIPGPYLIHGLPMQIMEKRQRSAPRPSSPLRSEVTAEEEEEYLVDDKKDKKDKKNEKDTKDEKDSKVIKDIKDIKDNGETEGAATEVERKRLEDSQVLAASIPPIAATITTNDNTKVVMGMTEVERKRLEDSQVLVASFPPDTASVPSESAETKANNTDTKTESNTETNTKTATAGGAVKQAGISWFNPASGAVHTVSATGSVFVSGPNAVPVSTSVPVPVSASVPVSTSVPDRTSHSSTGVTPSTSTGTHRPPLMRTNAQAATAGGIPISESGTAVTIGNGHANANNEKEKKEEISGLPASSSSVPVGLGLMELAAPANTVTTDNGAVASSVDTRHNTVQATATEIATTAEPTMQLMTLESSGTISCLGAPMVPPSLLGQSRAGGGGLVPPSLGASKGEKEKEDEKANLSSATGSLKEPPVQDLCAPTAVMPGPSPTAPVPSPSPDSGAMKEALDMARRTKVTVRQAEEEKRREAEMAMEEAAYIGIKMLQTGAAIEKWRHACAEVEMEVPDDVHVIDDQEEVKQKGMGKDETKEHPVLERRDVQQHRDEPVDRRDAHAHAPHLPSSSDSSNPVVEVNTSITTTINTSASASMGNIPESTSSSSLPPKKSADGLGLGLPSDVSSVPAIRIVSVSSTPGAATAADEADRPMLSSAPSCTNLAALATGDTPLAPASSDASRITMTSEVRDGARIFHSAPVYRKRLLWSVIEEDQEDLDLFDFDEEEERRRVNEKWDRIERDQARLRARDSTTMALPLPLPTLGLSAGVGAGARALSGAWSRISSLVLSSPAGTSQYDADVEGSVVGDARGDAHGTCTSSSANVSSVSLVSGSGTTSSASADEVPHVAAETEVSLDDDDDDAVVPPPASASNSNSNSTSASTSDSGAPARPASKGYVASFMSRISLSRSSSSSTSTSTSDPTNTGRKSPGFVEHVDAPRGLALGRLGAAAARRFQQLF